MQSTRSSIPIVLSLLGLLFLTACDTTNTTSETEISEEQAQAVADVMADALSDQSDGMMSGLYDLTASVSRDGISYARVEKSADDRAWRGIQRDFSAEYDPETGEHLIQYRREVDRPRLSKLVSVNLSYIFEDVEGSFLEFPRRQSDDIATITFDGQRNGETTITRPRGVFESNVERDAQWVLSGLEDGTSTMALSGTQAHAGTQRVDRNGTVNTREYTLRVNIVDVTIRKPTEDNAPLEERISGTLEYEGSVTLVIDGEERSNTYSGTIELNGDGAARLRLMGFRNPFIINLANGDVDSA